MAQAYEGYFIGYRILSGNLLPQAGDDEGLYDETESARKYAQMARERLEKEFPGAAIEVDLQANASGGDGDDVYVETPEDDWREAESVAETVRQVTGKLWESWEWVVYSHCAYCNEKLRHDPAEVPAADDDEAWEKIASAGHAPGCEWVETRAHSRTV